MCFQLVHDQIYFKIFATVVVEVASNNDRPLIPSLWRLTDQKSWWSEMRAKYENLLMTLRLICPIIQFSCIIGFWLNVFSVILAFITINNLKYIKDIVKFFKCRSKVYVVAKSRNPRKQYKSTKLVQQRRCLPTSIQKHNLLQNPDTLDSSQWSIQFLAGEDLLYTGSQEPLSLKILAWGTLICSYVVSEKGGGCFLCIWCTKGVTLGFFQGTPRFSVGDPGL